MRAKISGASALLLSLNWPPALRTLAAGAAIYEALKVIVMVAEPTRAFICLINRVYRGFKGLSNGLPEGLQPGAAQILYGNKWRYFGPK
jgi:hypothetical protein